MHQNAEGARISKGETIKLEVSPLLTRGLVHSVSGTLTTPVNVLSIKHFTINSRKYDQSIRRSWEAELVSANDEYIDLVGEFAETVEHPELGRIEKGTVSHERFYLDRWYNYFIFERPAGKLRNYYINICMPPKIGDGVIDYVDLDIDVIVWPDGRTETLDLDDFERNSILYGYPDELREKALSTLDQINKMDGVKQTR